MFKKQDRNEIRVIRHARVRKKISGTTERPRLCVYRSNAHIYAQIIDDSVGKTLAAASTVEKDIAAQIGEIGGDAGELARIGGSLGLYTLTVVSGLGFHMLVTMSAILFLFRLHHPGRSFTGGVRLS